MFDRILWIPLRRLDLGDHTWELKHVLKYQFFPQHSTGDYLAQEMCKVLERDQFGKTLFILDGLDEVFQFLDKESPKHSLLNSLLSKPNIIITSRPHIALPKDLVAINMELEVIGFSPEQVTEYISRWGCKSPSEIHGFLEQNQLVLDLVRIPIQLDALCYTWDMYPWNRGIPPRTMTELYSAMETKLWFNDLRRRNRNPQTTFNDKLMPDFQVMELARDDRRFLQRLAFTGFSLETLDFDLDFYDRVVRHYGLEYRTDEPWATRFAGLSFLRSSDPSNELNNGKKAYHFIHLTFQEYFAALYFVEQWITGKPLTCLTRDLRNKVRKENIDTSQFLHKHKYSSYHNVFWRFVCGLLNRKLEDSVWPNNKTPFISELYSQTSFFSELNNYQDLVGHSHHRLIMHCLMEVEDTNEAEGNVEAKDVINLRHTLEDRLSEWLKLQSHAGGSYKLTSSVEFPVRCIVSVLQRSSPVTKVALLASLEHQSHLSNAILEAIDERTQDDSLELRHHASAAMKSRQLPEHIKQATVERLWHEKRDIRLAALDILTAQNSLPKGSTEEILRLFDDEDEDIRLKAIEVFKTTRDPGAVNVALPKLREDCNQKVRLATLHLFEVHENSLSIPWENILTPHRGDDKEVYLASITLLKDRPELPDRVLQRLLGGLAHPSDEFDDEGARLEQIKFLKEHTGNPELLKLYTDFTRSRPSPTTSSGDEEVRLATMKFLKDRPNLPDTILIQLAKGLAHRNDKARSISVDLLQAQQSLSITVRNAITQGLGQGRVFQIAASAVLRSQRDLADHILHSFRKLLDDEDAQVRWNAFCVLAGQKDLSEDHLRAITGTLKTVETITDLNIVRHCMQLWKKPSSYLADDTMSSFKPLLCDQHGYVRLNVLAILEVQEAFPPDVMKYLTSRLQDPQTVINERDVSVFQNLEHLPEPSSKAIAALLHHGRVDVRSAASNVLKERDFLPTSVLGKITVDLKDGNTEVRLAAIKAIGGLAEPLSCHMYDVIESLLQNDTQKVRFVICQTLRHHSRLSDSILRAVVELCQTNDENVCKEARSVLCDMGLPGLKVYPQSTLQGSASCVQRPCDEDQPTTVQGSGSQDIHHTATIEAVRQLLRHNEDAQIAVIYRFRNHYQPLSMMELEVMTMGIQDVRERIQLEAITSICLYGPTPLPRHTVQAIWPLIRSSNDEIRCKALEALYDEHISSLEDLNAIAELLNDQSNEVRSEASSILGHQENPLLMSRSS
ncbi:hypothetical protein NXS19_000084 [Fusarium pseudograminearum]|nr:hypothetical protein NXS19_000084 [Fusarium pseudograminearum]